MSALYPHSVDGKPNQPRSNDGGAVGRVRAFLEARTEKAQGLDRELIYAYNDHELRTSDLTALVESASIAEAAVRARIAHEIRDQALTEAADEIHREARWQRESQIRGMFANGETSIDRLLMLEKIIRPGARGTQEAPK